MKILAFQGSPRKGGNTDLLLDAFLKGAQEAGVETEKIYLAKVRITPCLECGQCDQTGICVIEDDMAWIYPKIEEADLIVISSPVFFYNLTAYTQALIERAQACWVRKYILKKPPPLEKERIGLLFSVGATKGPRLFEGMIRVVRYFFEAIYARYEGGLFYRGMEKKGAILEHPTALTQAFHLGKSINLPPAEWPVVRSLSP